MYVLGSDVGGISKDLAASVNLTTTPSIYRDREWLDGATKLPARNTSQRELRVDPLWRN